MKFNVDKFLYYPYLKRSLGLCNFPMNLVNTFKESYDNLPFDSYISDKSRQRRYANYHITNIDNTNFSIKHTNKTTFKQDVRDSRAEERIFELIENPYDPFILNFITLSSQLVNYNCPIEELSIDIHQVRQICYPDLEAHNSAEGIHQDGCNYVIPACVLNRYNITGGYSSVYNKNKEILYRTLIEENEFLFQDDKILYHYVTPINYSDQYPDKEFGYRDIIGLDINIL